MRRFDTIRPPAVRDDPSRPKRAGQPQGFLRGGALFVCVALVAASLDAQTTASPIRGRVLNGTTNRPAANLKVEYVLLQQGMIPVATAATGRDGRFVFENVARSAGAPALLRIEYQGATYSHPLAPRQSGPGDVEIQVYDAGPEPGLVSVKGQVIFVHPSGDTLTVFEIVLLENHSSPPRTYVNPKGTYLFTVPGAPREGMTVSVTGPAGMPINQTPTKREKDNRFAITYPIRPGETQVRLQYALDYHSPFEFSKPLDLPAENTQVVTPGKEVQVAGETLVPVETDPSTGFVRYQVTPVANVIRLKVSGEVPPTVGEEGAQASGQSGTLAPIPDPLSRWRWVILGVAGLVMLGGFVYHCTRS